MEREPERESERSPERYPDRYPEKGPESSYREKIRRYGKRAAVISGKRLRGSATVEAVYIIPFTFFVILSLMIMILLLYDRQKLGGDIRETLEYARQQKEQEGSYDAARVKAHLEGLTGKGYLLCDVDGISVTAKGSRVTVCAEIRMRSPAGIMGIDFPSFTKVSGSTETKDREQITRMGQAGRLLVRKAVE